MDRAGFRPGDARRAYAAVGALIGVLLPELVISAVGAVTPHRRGTRYFIGPSREAVLTVRAARDGWHVENHVSAHLGTKQGKALRELVAPSLRKAADAAGVAILVGGANIKLATIYKKQLEKLVVVDRGDLSDTTTSGGHRYVEKTLSANVRDPPG